MSRLVMVRHAQASFLKDDYDQLSEHGFGQARQLAESWVERGIEFDEWYVGPRLRHAQTADTIEGVFRGANRSVPERIVVDGFDEHGVDQLVTQHFAELCRQLTGLQPLVDSLGSDEWRNNPRSFQSIFEFVCLAWIRGETAGIAIEPWRDFHKRVNSAIQEILVRKGRSRRVVVVTSVGPIAVTLQRALQIEAAPAMEAGWRARNTCLSEFVFSGDRMTLDSYNSMTHLPNPNDWTFR